MPLLDPQFATRRWLKLGLTVAGAVAGGIFGLALTKIGKIATGAPPATLSNYAWNAAVFAALGAFVSPIVTWSVLRRVPLWRTIAEPLALAVAGGAVSLLFPVTGLFLLLPPLGLAAGFIHLQRRFPDPDAQHARLPGNDAPPRLE